MVISGALGTSILVFSLRRRAYLHIFDLFFSRTLKRSQKVTKRSPKRPQRSLPGDLLCYFLMRSVSFISIFSKICWFLVLLRGRFCNFRCRFGDSGVDLGTSGVDFVASGLWLWSLWASILVLMRPGCGETVRQVRARSTRRRRRQPATTRSGNNRTQQISLCFKLSTSVSIIN